MTILLGLYGGQVYYPFGQPPDGVEVMWRCDARRYSYTIDDDVYGLTDPRIELTWWPIKHRTPCGVRLECGKLVFTGDHVTRRKWASPTPKQAVESYIAKRKRQISILESQVRRAQVELSLAEAVTL